MSGTMKTTEPTPGPWTLNRCTGVASGCFTITTPRGDTIISRMKGETNARLIAKAPELRARLERMATALSTAASYIARDTDTGIADGFESEANETRALLAAIDGMEAL